MLILALKPGHDGAIAAISDRKLLFSLEAEKDSFRRFSAITASVIIDAAARLGDIPDIIALGGWQEQDQGLQRSVGAGYHGTMPGTCRPVTLFGKPSQFFTSTHERSHIMMAIGMAPPGDYPAQAVLVWEGDTGAFYLIDRNLTITRRIPVLTQPGARYAFLFALCDPAFPDTGALPRLNDAGKLMALAAYAPSGDPDAATTRAVEEILTAPGMYPAPKAGFRGSPLYNCGPESEQAKAAAALLTRRIFDTFAAAARQHLPAGLPLRISGGCGLNCDWNAQWAQLEHFASVFVPPCASDSGSAIGTAIDALTAITGNPHITWDVYSGLEFIRDATPEASKWRRMPLDFGMLARAISTGRITAWVQGRWEIGPRALGHRSILAEPFTTTTRDRLNKIKGREAYRPIAPCCRVEDAGLAFREDFHDPYMLYFRHVRSEQLSAITHVDGTARAQTVDQESNRALHKLLTTFAALRGIGVLCNTSLNYNSHGFINRMSHLTDFCEARGITDMVVGDDWYQAL